MISDQTADSMIATLLDTPADFVVKPNLWKVCRSCALLTGLDSTDAKILFWSAMDATTSRSKELVMIRIS